MFRPLYCVPVRYCRPLLNRRLLSLQEYHSKQLLREHNCTVQKFFVVDSVENADKEFQKYGKNSELNSLNPLFILDYEEYAVKSQLLAGGRGKGRFINGPPNFSGVQITKE